MGFFFLFVCCFIFIFWAKRFCRFVARNGKREIGRKQLLIALALLLAVYVSNQIVSHSNQLTALFT